MGYNIVFASDATDFLSLNPTVKLNERNASFSREPIELLNSNVPVTNYATTENQQWKLSGNVKLLEIGTNAKYTYMSQRLSSSVSRDGYDDRYPFTDSLGEVKKITMTINFMDYINTSGLTFLFAGYETFASEIEIYLYKDSELLNVIYEYPKNSIYSADFINDYQVDEIQIHFLTMNKPNVFLKLWWIINGYSKILDDSNIFALNMLERMSLTGEALPSNTMEATIEIPQDMEIKIGQHIYIYKNSEIRANLYIDEIENVYKNKYDIVAVDILYLLEKSQAQGCFYQNESPKNVGEAIDELFSGTNIYYTVSDDIASKSICGYSPPCSKKERLKQILIASGAVLVTPRNSGVKIFSLSPSNMKTLSQIDVLEGGIITTTSNYNNIVLDVYNYKLGRSRKTMFSLDNIPKGSDYILTEYFKTPLYMGEWRDEFLGDEDEGTIIDKGAIYLSVPDDPFDTLEHPNADLYKIDTFGFTGRIRIRNTPKRRVENGLIPAQGVNGTDVYVYKNNVATISGYTYDENVTQVTAKKEINESSNENNSLNVKGLQFVSANNAENVLNIICKEYFDKKTLVFECEVENLNCGDYISVPTEWQGEKRGYIESIEYTYGARLIGEVTVRIDG